MRVVVEEGADLLVEPGVSFRDGSNPTDSYDSTLDPTTGKFAGSDNNGIFDTGSPSTGASDALGADVDLDDLPVAFVSNDTNGDISIQVAVALGETATFEDMLQVTNNTGNSVDVGIKFSAFGVDTTTNNLSGPGDFTDKGGAVDIRNAFGAYEFTDGSNTVSTTSIDDPPTLDGQVIGSALSVSDGTTEQITLDVDMTSNVSAGGNDLETEVNSAASAANPGSNPFAEKEDTVQLIQEITVGTGANTEV
jgi:hypothetical protein